MAHEPRRLVGHLDRAVELVGADALLAPAHQVEGQQPLVQGHMALLQHGADRDRELTLAIVAVIEALAVGFLGAFDLMDAARLGLTVRAHGTVGPAGGLQVFAGCVGVIEDRIGEVGHGSIPYEPKYSASNIFCKVHNAAQKTLRRANRSRRVSLSQRTG